MLTRRCIMKFKQVLVRCLGLFTTALSIALIYLILFKDGHLQNLTIPVLIEFIVIITLATSTKFFWYTSTEDAIRSSDEYIGKRTIVTKAINDEVKDAQDFDTFINVENDNNYNIYVSKYCKNITEYNYKLSVIDWLHKLFYKKDKQFYMIRYMLKIERKANRLHKLSSFCIQSLTQSDDGLTDDRNNASRKKLMFLFTGIVFSAISMYFTAAIMFTYKDNIDMQYTILKMTIYVANILFSILQAVLKARMTVATEDIAYFNKILSILEKYAAYKKNRIIVTKVSYIPKEVKNGGDNLSIEAKIDVDSSGGSTRTGVV